MFAACCVLLCKQHSRNAAGGNSRALHQARLRLCEPVACIRRRASMGVVPSKRAPVRRVQHAPRRPDLRCHHKIRWRELYGVLHRQLQPLCCHKGESRNQKPPLGLSQHGLVLLPSHYVYRHQALFEAAQVVQKRHRRQHTVFPFRIRLGNGAGRLHGECRNLHPVPRRSPHLPLERRLLLPRHFL